MEEVEGMIFIIALIFWCGLNLYFRSPLRHHGFSVFTFSSEFSLFNNALVANALKFLLLETVIWASWAGSGIVAFYYLFAYGMPKINLIFDGSIWGLLISIILSMAAVILPAFAFISISQLMNVWFPHLKESHEKLKRD